MRELACLCMRGEGGEEKLINIPLVDLHFEFSYLFNLQHVISRRSSYLSEYYAAIMLPIVFVDSEVLLG